MSAREFVLQPMRCGKRSWVMMRMLDELKRGTAVFNISVDADGRMKVERLRATEDGFVLEPIEPGGAHRAFLDAARDESVPAIFFDIDTLGEDFVGCVELPSPVTAAELFATIAPPKKTSMTRPSRRPPEYLQHDSTKRARRRKEPRGSRYARKGFRG